MLLLLEQSSWTHRRVESVSFLPSGETRRRISWDFTLPEGRDIPASKQRVAVPLATLRKQPLKRLDVLSGDGSALPVWGREDNGELAFDLLCDPLVTFMGSEPTARQKDLVRDIVFAENEAAADPCIVELLATVPEQRGNNAAAIPAFEALVRDFANNFLFVVELPVDAVGQRTIVKMSYEDDLAAGEGHSKLGTRHETTIDGGSWASAQSWHLEVHAPDGLAISDLNYESWSETDDIVDAKVSDSTGHTAHISGAGADLGTSSQAQLSLRPSAVGLVNQMMAGSVLAWVLITASCLGIEHLKVVSVNADRAGAVAGVTLALPAFFLAMLSRSQEHRLVSQLLLAPRVACLLTAAVLLAGAAAIVLGVSGETLEGSLKSLFAAQTALLIWSWAIRRGSVGGDT